MDLTLIILCVITIAISGVIFYISGWKRGLIRVGYILVTTAIYSATVYFYGQEGKEYLAVALVVLVTCFFLYTRTKKGKKVLEAMRRY